MCIHTCINHDTGYNMDKKVAKALSIATFNCQGGNHISAREKIVHIIINANTQTTRRSFLARNAYQY